MFLTNFGNIASITGHTFEKRNNIELNEQMEIRVDFCIYKIYIYIIDKT